MKLYASNASAWMTAGEFKAGVSSAAVALVVKSGNGVILEASGSANMGLSSVLQVNAASTKVRWNSTNQAVVANQAMTVAGQTHQFGAMDVGLQEVALTGASVVAGDFLRLSGNFAVHHSSTPKIPRISRDRIIAWRPPTG
jgi:hypothetical protein